MQPAMQPAMHPTALAGPSGSHVVAPRRAPSTSRRGPFDVPLTPPFFDYVVDRLVDTVVASLDPAWRAEQAHTLRQPRLRWWVEEVITKARCRSSTVLVALGYLDRAGPNMRISMGALPCERALMGSLVLANKYTNDEVYSTKAWAHAAGLTSTRDVVKAERELLQVLRFDLKVSGLVLASHYEAIRLRCLRPTISIATHTRAPPVLRAAPQFPRYAPNPVPSIHALRRASVDSTMSSGSASPLDSPEVQTPESYPYNVPAHVMSDAKRTHAPVALAVPPYILDVPDVYPQGFRNPQPYDQPLPYLLAGGKDFGEVAPLSQTSLLAELYGDLDVSFVPALSDVAPPFVPNFHAPAAHQWPELSGPFIENTLPFDHRVQNTTIPYAF